jgi:hypothetical protein
MKKLLLVFVIFAMGSCIAPYNTRHQHRVMTRFDKPKRGVHGKRGDHYHPAVRKETRNALKWNH